MISATELVPTAPARSTGFVTFSGSLGSAKVFARSPTRLVMGASRAELRPAFLGRIACPTATTTAAHSRHPRATSTLLAETAGQRLHRELVLRFRPRSISARHKTTKRGRHGQPARRLRRRCRPAARPAIAAIWAWGQSDTEIYSNKTVIACLGSQHPSWTIMINCLEPETRKLMSGQVVA